MKELLLKIQKIALAAGLTLVPLMHIETVYADNLGAFTEYTIPTANSKPYGIAEGFDGNLWFTEELGQKIGKMTKSGSFTEYNVGFSVNHISQGSDGNMWFTGSNKVGKITPNGTGTYTDLSYSTQGGVVAGPDGNMWVGNYAGNNANGYVTVFNTGLSVVKNFSVGGQVVELTADHANDLVWYATRELNSFGGYTGTQIIGKIASDGTITPYVLPLTMGSLFSVTIGPDGNVWFAGGGNKIGKITLDGTTTIYTLPTSNAGLWRVRTGLDGNIWATESSINKIARVTTSGTATEYNLPDFWGRPIGLATGTDGNMWFTEYNDNKITKIGTSVTFSTIDSDNDGLNYGLELAQGTSDFDRDTDSDGLSDLTESTSYNNRTAVFCDNTVSTCAYPKPLIKDIYIEVDWMVVPDPDGFNAKPNSAVIAAVTTAFLNKNIIIHFDTGQLGGGNQIPYTSLLPILPDAAGIDFYDYKLGGNGVTPQFDVNRQDIYHYMIFGNKYAEYPLSSGGGFPGDDDSFIAFGRILEINPPSLDTGVAGTIMHEIGHNLCLTDLNGGNPAYPNQPASCRFSGIETYAGISYPSSMNYSRQFDLVDYSIGTNGVNDHNDWAAIRLQDFINSSTGDSSHGASKYNKKELKTKLKVSSF